MAIDRTAEAVKTSMDDAAVKSERRIPALAVSRGIGIGRVVFYDDAKRPVQRSVIEVARIEREIERFHATVSICTDQLKTLIAADEATPDDPLANILNLQLLILEQSSFVENVENLIRSKRFNPEWAVREVSDEYVRKQSAASDPHLREKRLDIQDVCSRVLAALDDGSDHGIKSSYTGAIVAAHELTPSSVIELVKSRPAGVITERGGWTSHTSILAREFMIPMVSGVRNFRNVIREGDQVIVDGESGIAIINPGAGTSTDYERMQQQFALESVDVGTESRSETLDGTQIAIRANVDIPEAYDLARQFGAEGIGLFRSESLIAVPGSVPSEDEQFTAYRQMAEVAGAAGVRIRTYDVGLERLKADSGTEVNPSLGLRSIRLSLHEQSYFRTQVRAILRASANNRIDILLPMISGVGEVVRAQEIIEEERSLLAEKGIPIGNPLIGAMIEVPSGVFVATEIARRVDFMALGTNDLVQYMLAVDRDNDSVADWYQTLHPAVLRAIKQVIDAAKETGIPMVVCGEMAGSAFYVPLLIGLGATELSMNVNSISQIRHLISGITSEKTVELVSSLSDCETSDQVESKLRTYYAENWPHLFPYGLLDAKHR